MNFQQAEEKFKDLENRLAAGQISLDAYRVELARLEVVDPNGAHWQMQERTGRWFYYQQGQWVEWTAPNQRAEAPVHAAATVLASPPSGVAAPTAAAPIKTAPRPKKSRRIGWVLAVVGMLGACVLCSGVGVGGYLYSQDMLPALPNLAQLAGAAPQTAAGPTLQVKAAETTAIASDGSPHTDAHGVSLTIPTSALPPGEEVNLTANDLQTSWRADLEKEFTLDKPFYSLTTQGKDDSAGLVYLTFPAVNDQSRLVAVVDGEYLVELGTLPKDGKLFLQTRAAPSDRTGVPTPARLDGPGSIYYTVITPKTASRAPSGIQPVRFNFTYHSDIDERSCIPGFTFSGRASINLCRQNPDRTIQVLLPVAKRDLQPQVDQMVDKIEGVMKKYADLGFTNAQLSTSAPLMVRVSTTITSPSYYPLNGVLYIPVDTVQNIASTTPDDVYHEMAHWIQAMKYSTTVAYYSQEKTWWLETGAENMVMLVDPSYLGGNLRTYGTITQSDNTLAFQASPYQWPADFYVQAQLVKVNMCDGSACPLSAASFAEAISKGTYPLMDGGKKGQVSGNLNDYAFYLLGKSPSHTNTAISLSGPVKTGEGYGETVSITRTNSADIKYDYTGSDPQMRKEAKDGKDSLVVEAKLQKDGVYPLMVSGAAGQYAGLPVALVIEPGASFYYTIDNGELKYSDGGQELTIQPIHAGMGTAQVRLVALGTNGGEVFKARIEPINLDGAWVLFPGQKKSSSITCTGSDDSDSPPETRGQLMAALIYLISGTGDMHTDPTGRSLDWSLIPGRVPDKMDPSLFKYQASALLSGEGIRYQAELEINKAPKSQLIPAGVPTAAGGTGEMAAAALVGVPVVWLGTKQLKKPRTRRTLSTLLLAALIGMLATSCVGFDIYGTGTVDATLNKVEYVGGTDTGLVSLSAESGQGAPTGKPMWKMSGTATYDINLSLDTSVDNPDGTTTNNTEHCTGKITYPVTMYVYKDVTVQIENKK